MISRRSFLATTSMAAFAIPGRHLFALSPAQTATQTAAQTAGQIATQTVVQAATVSTPNGVLRGESSAGVRVFRGVSFAAPPVGPLRFRPAQNAGPWKGELNATAFAAAPLQKGQRKVPQSEDCLYLNIWAPEGTGPFPVFVWIHGGGFTGGHAFEEMYDGSAFAREGIVSISVGYRLGVFGFLDFEPLLGAQYAGTANNALTDLIAALEWIQKNISAFGGDPARVTIGGESAGAKLTDILMGTPSAQPLFHQMISESGGAERIWARATSADISKGFGEIWQRQSTDPIASIRTAAGDALIKAQNELMDTWPQHFPLRPEIDGTLIAQLPVTTIAAGSTRGKRLLLGTNREESALFIGPHPAKDITANQIGNMSLDAFDKVYAKYAEIYPELSVEQRRIRAVTAEEYWVPSLRVAAAQVQGGGSAYVYELEFAETSGKLKGYAYHSLDVGMVWGHPHAKVADADAEAALGVQMHTAWAAFIRGETPAAPGLPVWPEYTAETRATMILGSGASATSRVEQAPQAAELALWNGLL